jgi:hypothetical protein
LLDEVKRLLSWAFDPAIDVDIDRGEITHRPPLMAKHWQWFNWDHCRTTLLSGE